MSLPSIMEDSMTEEPSSLELDEQRAICLPQSAPASSISHPLIADVDEARTKISRSLPSTPLRPFMARSFLARSRISERPRSEPAASRANWFPVEESLVPRLTNGKPLNRALSDTNSKQFSPEYRQGNSTRPRQSRSTTDFEALARVGTNDRIPLKSNICATYQPAPDLESFEPLTMYLLVDPGWDPSQGDATVFCVTCSPGQLPSSPIRTTTSPADYVVTTSYHIEHDSSHCLSHFSEQVVTPLDRPHDDQMVSADSILESFLEFF